MGEWGLLLSSTRRVRIHQQRSIGRVDSLGPGLHNGNIIARLSSHFIADLFQSPPRANLIEPKAVGGEGGEREEGMWWDHLKGLHFLTPISNFTPFPDLSWL